jgi:transposase-like protein
MSRNTVFTGAWRKLVEARGGVAKLAEELGVSPSTLWKWYRGYPMSRANKRYVHEYASRRGLPDPTVRCKVGKR